MSTDLHCIKCGYNLTGVCSKEREEGDCPECGHPFSFQELDYLRRFGTDGRLRQHSKRLVLISIAAGVAAAVCTLLALHMQLSDRPVDILPILVLPALFVAGSVAHTLRKWRREGWQPEEGTSTVSLGCSLDLSLLVVYVIAMFGTWFLIGLVMWALDALDMYLR